MAGVATEVDVEGAELVEDVEVPALGGVVNGVSVGPTVVLTPAEAGAGEGLYVVVVAPSE